MAARIRVSRTARLDLKRIVDYWTARAGVETSQRLSDQIVEALVMLASQPRAGAKRPQFGADVRMFPASRFLIYYRPYRGGIQVIHVFDGAQDQDQAWG